MYSMINHNRISGPPPSSPTSSPMTSFPTSYYSAGRGIITPTNDNDGVDSSCDESVDHIGDGMKGAITPMTNEMTAKGSKAASTPTAVLSSTTALSSSMVISYPTALDHALLAVDVATEKPKRPCSVYNLFYQIEREHILQTLKGGEGGKEKEQGEEVKHNDDETKDGTSKGVDGTSNGNDNGDEKDDDEPPRPPRYAGIRLARHWYKSGQRVRKHRRTNAPVGFKELNKMISGRWANTDGEIKAYLKGISDLEWALYRTRLKEYETRRKELVDSIRAKYGSAEAAREERMEKGESVRRADVKRAREVLRNRRNVMNDDEATGGNTKKHGRDAASRAVEGLQLSMGDEERQLQERGERLRVEHQLHMRQFQHFQRQLRTQQQQKEQQQRQQRQEQEQQQQEQGQEQQRLLRDKKMEELVQLRNELEMSQELLDMRRTMLLSSPPKEEEGRDNQDRDSIPRDIHPRDTVPQHAPHCRRISETSSNLESKSSSREAMKRKIAMMKFPEEMKALPSWESEDRALSLSLLRMIQEDETKKGADMQRTNALHRKVSSTSGLPTASAFPDQFVAKQQQQLKRKIAERETGAQAGGYMMHHPFYQAAASTGKATSSAPSSSTADPPRRRQPQPHLEPMQSEPPPRDDGAAKKERRLDVKRLEFIHAMRRYREEREGGRRGNASDDADAMAMAVRMLDPASGMTDMVLRKERRSSSSRDSAAEVLRQSSRPSDFGPCFEPRTPFPPMTAGATQLSPLSDSSYRNMICNSSISDGILCGPTAATVKKRHGALCRTSIRRKNMNATMTDMNTKTSGVPLPASPKDDFDTLLHSTFHPVDHLNPASLSPCGTFASEWEEGGGPPPSKRRRHRQHTPPSFPFPPPPFGGDALSFDARKMTGTSTGAVVSATNPKMRVYRLLNTDNDKYNEDYYHPTEMASHHCHDGTQRGGQFYNVTR